MKRFCSSLRARLLALVFLTITPAMGLATYHWLENRREQNLTAAKQTSLLLGNITREQHRLIERTKAITEQLAQMPEVKAGEPAKCSTTLAEWSKRYFRFANFGVVNLDGTIFCSAVPLDESVNEGDRQWFDNTVRTQAFSTGNYYVGPITGLPVLVFGQPVFDSSGQLRFVLFAAVDLRWIHEYWREEQFPAGSIFMVVERTGAMLARYPDPEKWARRIFGDNDPLFKAIISQNGEGTFETTAPDGMGRLFSVTKLGGEYLSAETFAVIGIPRRALFAAADKKFMINATILVAVSALLLFLGWYGSSRLVLRQVKALLDSTNRLAGGDLAARTGIRENVGELNQLAHSFDRMAEQLQEQRDKLLRSQEKLSHSEDRLRGILEALPIAAYTCDGDGKITYYNERASRLWGCAPKLDEPDLPSSGSMQPFQAGNVPVLHDFIVEALREKRDVIGREIAVEGPGGDKRTLLAHANLLWNAAGEITGVVSALVDITERIKAEQALRDSEGRLKLALAAARMGVWEWNTANAEIYCSPEACDIVGLKGVHPTREMFDGLVHPEDLARVNAAIDKALAEKSIYTAEFRIIPPHGETVWVLTLGRAEYEESGSPVRMIGIVQDITRRRRLMDQVRERAEQLAEVDRRKDEFLALLAHELRNPLAPIMNAVEILRMNGSSGAEHDWIVGVIDRQIRHLIRLVDDLLDVSRITRGKLELRKERLDLRQAVKSAVETNLALVESSRLDLNVTLPPFAIDVDGDMVRLVQIFSNLLTNSVKYSDDGGSIDVNLRLDGNEVVTTVQDTGI
ncbi:MAG: PAS domain S-box protein, partial [Deltaproteobacteria bacterium]|nr:PAS domain S-box protein [Deltaproteobacteria bacterium]